MWDAQSILTEAIQILSDFYAKVIQSDFARLESPQRPSSKREALLTSSREKRWEVLGTVWRASLTILISAITPPNSSVNTWRAVSQDIYQRICPTVVEVGANITLEDCKDTMHQVVGKAQQLFAYLVSDKTVPNKLKVLFATFGYLGYSSREVGEDTV